MSLPGLMLALGIVATAVSLITALRAERLSRRMGQARLPIAPDDFVILGDDAILTDAQVEEAVKQIRDYAGEVTITVESDHARTTRLSNQAAHASSAPPQRRAADRKNAGEHKNSSTEITKRRTRTAGTLAGLLMPSDDAAELIDQLRDDVATRLETGKAVPRLIGLSFAFRAIVPMAVATALGRTRARVFGR